MDLSSSHWALLNKKVPSILSDEGYIAMGYTELKELRRLEMDRCAISRKGLIYAIDKRLIPKPDVDDGRHIARKIEDERVTWLCSEINTRSEFGLEMVSSHKSLFGKDIASVIKKGSNRDHYDITIHYKDGTTKKCEEKGTDNYQIDLGSFEIPWANSVQRFNGLGNQFKIGIKYAEMWYEKVVMDTVLTTDYNITCSVPTISDWLKGDAFQCGDPTTDWGKSLKENYRIRHPGSSMNNKKGSPYDYRLNVNKIFIEAFNEEDKQILLKEVQCKLDDIMNEKECWLQTSGKITDKLSFKWYDKIISPKINDVNLTWREGADIYFNFIAEEENYNFQCILRFGKGTGFSNIRFDIR